MKELKIVFKIKDDLLNTENITVCIDDDAIGTITDLDLSSSLSITFPEESLDVNLEAHLQSYISQLKSIKNINILEKKK